MQLLLLVLSISTCVSYSLAGGLVQLRSMEMKLQAELEPLDESSVRKEVASPNRILDTALSKYITLAIVPIIWGTYTPAVKVILIYSVTLTSMNLISANEYISFLLSCRSFILSYSSRPHTFSSTLCHILYHLRRCHSRRLSSRVQQVLTRPPAHQRTSWQCL